MHPKYKHVSTAKSFIRNMNNQQTISSIQDRKLRHLCSTVFKKAKATQYTLKRVIKEKQTKSNLYFICCDIIVAAKHIIKACQSKQPNLYQIKINFLRFCNLTNRYTVELSRYNRSNRFLSKVPDSNTKQVVFELVSEDLSQLQTFKNSTRQPLSLDHDAVAQSLNYANTISTTTSFQSSIPTKTSAICQNNNFNNNNIINEKRSFSIIAKNENDYLEDPKKNICYKDFGVIENNNINQFNNNDNNTVLKPTPKRRRLIPSPTSTSSSSPLSTPSPTIDIMTTSTSQSNWSNSSVTKVSSPSSGTCFRPISVSDVQHKPSNHTT